MNIYAKVVDKGIEDKWTPVEKQ